MSPKERTRRYRARKAQQRLEAATILCGCGCGTSIPSITVTGSPARYAHGHNPRYVIPKGAKPWNLGKKMGPSPKRGNVLPPEQIARRTATRRARFNGNYVSAERGRGNPAYDNRPRHPRAQSAGGIRADIGRYFRSRWEANYARYLNAMGRTWVYEPSVFALNMPDGSTREYRPDFLVDDSYFVELKGFFPEQAKPMLDVAMAQLPKPLLVIHKAEYRALERGKGDSIIGWEFDKSPRPTDTPAVCPTCHEPVKRLNQTYCSRQCQPHPFTGMKLSPESIARRTATRLAKYGSYFQKA